MCLSVTGGQWKQLDLERQEALFYYNDAPPQPSRVLLPSLSRIMSEVVPFTLSLGFTASYIIVNSSSSSTISSLKASNWRHDLVNPGGMILVVFLIAKSLESAYNIAVC